MGLNAGLSEGDVEGEPVHDRRAESRVGEGLGPARERRLSHYAVDTTSEDVTAVNGHGGSVANLLVAYGT